MNELKQELTSIKKTDSFLIKQQELESLQIKCHAFLKKAEETSRHALKQEKVNFEKERRNEMDLAELEELRRQTDNAVKESGLLHTKVFKSITLHNMYKQSNVHMLIVEW